MIVIVFSVIVAAAVAAVVVTAGVFFSCSVVLAFLFTVVLLISILRWTKWEWLAGVSTFLHLRLHVVM
jgi:hypothetical protein